MVSPTIAFCFLKLSPFPFNSYENIDRNCNYNLNHHEPKPDCIVHPDLLFTDRH